ncbi:MAG: bifunctional phosphoribosylaminoimidazolecarboxamide formyltransferase/IMP cyclohydrolase [Beijerinckiaceae bacterium]
MPNSLRRAARALLSVSDKTGLIELASALHARGVELVSTGGTAKAIAAAGLPVMDVADLTGFPEMMDGRVKTLHPNVHGGLLAVRGNPEHEASMLAHGIRPIDILIVNLYPFEATLKKGAGFADCVENIDIGGPAMIRAASKNFDGVAVIVDAEDYQPLLDELAANAGATTRTFRQQLAAKAFARTAAYDTMISTWLAAQSGIAAPKRMSFTGELAQTLRYGENPHQSAQFYRTAESRPGVATARQVQGKELSFNNINDTDAAYECVGEFPAGEAAACVIVKHANPCGVAVAATMADAYRMALRCDPVSAFGGIIALNRRLDRATAEEVSKIFTEVIIAPDADEDAIAVIAAKKNLRLLLAGGLPDPSAGGVTVRSVAGGLLVQGRDDIAFDAAALRVVTKRAPTAREMADMQFAFRVAKHVKSNAIVFAKDGATAGVGAGQMSRVDSARIAAWKGEEAAKASGLAESLTRGSVAASDAFFPFADGLDAIIAAGATAVIQPGGSMRDDEVIAAADRAGIAMVFTGLRHFRH